MSYPSETSSGSGLAVAVAAVVKLDSAAAAVVGLAIAGPIVGRPT